MTRKRTTRKKPKPNAPTPVWGWTVADVAGLLGIALHGPAGENDVLDLLEGGALDAYVLLDQLVAGRLRFDPSIGVWLVLLGELAAWTTRGVMTEAEAMSVYHQCAPTIPQAFDRAIELVRAGTPPTETRVAFTLKREHDHEIPVTLHYLEACVELATP